MVLNKVWLIPLSCFVFSIMAFVSSYVISVSMGHVNAFLPFLSDSGTLHPESSIFGQLLNLSALFLALTVYLRHRQIVEFYWHRHHIRDGGFGWRFWSTLLLWIGFVSALGVSMVANFQQSVTTLYYHYLGALLAFGNGLVYAWAMTIFSYIMTPKLFDKRLSHCRCLLCVIATVAFLTMIIFGCILGRANENDLENIETSKHLLHWNPGMKNYTEHTVGTISEWILAVCFQIYILSFAIELKRATLHAPKLLISSDLDLTIDSRSQGSASTTSSGLSFTDVIFSTPKMTINDVNVVKY